MNLTDEQLEWLRTLEAGACPAPWKWRKDDLGHAVPGLPGTGAVLMVEGHCDDCEGLVQIWGRDDDRALIVAMRNSLPALLSEVTVLRGVVAAMEEERTALRSQVERVRRRCDDWQHGDMCDRTDSCDDAVEIQGHECHEHGHECPDCSCTKGEIQEALSGGERE